MICKSRTRACSAQGREGEKACPSCLPSHTPQALNTIRHSMTKSLQDSVQQGIARYKVGFLSTGAFPHQPMSSTKASGQSFSSVALCRAQLGEEVPNVLTFSRALPWHQCTAKTGGCISKYRLQNDQMLCWHNWKYSKMFIPNRGSMQAPVFVALTPLHLTSSSITDISLASVGTTAGICKTAVNFRLIASLKVSLEQGLLTLHSMPSYPSKTWATISGLDLSMFP